MMAALTQGVFNHNLPWDMLGLGAAIIIAFIVLNQIIKIWQLELSILAVAIGMYLPLSSSLPLFLGGVIALLSKRILFKREQITKINQKESAQIKWQCGLLLACGLVAGAALMDVLLAIPMGIAGNPDILVLLPKNKAFLANGLGILTVLGIGYWFYRIAISEK